MLLEKAFIGTDDIRMQGAGLPLPVCSQPGGYVSSRDLRHDVAPEERSVNQPHRLWIPVELGFLVHKNETIRILL